LHRDVNASLLNRPAINAIRQVARRARSIAKRTYSLEPWGTGHWCTDVPLKAVLEKNVSIFPASTPVVAITFRTRGTPLIESQSTLVQPVTFPVVVDKNVSVAAAENHVVGITSGTLLPAIISKTLVALPTGLITQTEALLAPGANAQR